MSSIRTRWAAIGAAVAVAFGAGGMTAVRAAVSVGERTVFVPITPCRLFDTRPEFQVGPKSSPVGPGETFTVSAIGANGNCTIPADAVGLALNLTATAATLPTFISIWAADAPKPTASSLNPTPGAPPIPNGVVTDLSSTGQFNVYNLQGAVHVFADITGYYADHNHDDRYFTEAEVNALIAATPAPWRTIPSGTTVIGPIRWDEQSPAAGGDYRLYIPFSAVAPAEPSAANWAPDASAGTVDDDATCTGNATNPTAPAGKVCLYLVNAANASSMTGEVSIGYLRRGFEIWWSPTAVGDMFVYGAWAYTAP